MKKLLFAVVLVLVLTGCKKHVDNTTPSTGTPTAVGTPVGALVSKTIGKSGGSILSADGNAELVFPAGSLDNNTVISVQALTNQAPNGVGNTYEFLPDGIQFLQPVVLKFHYKADDLAATMGDLMGIAFQDSAGVWWRVNNFTNDTAGKTISAPIRHFTSYTPFDLLQIFPASNSLRVGKSLSMHVEMVVSDDDLLTDIKGDEVAPLISLKSKKVVWSANGAVGGNGTAGTVSGTGLDATFKAPAKVPSQNPVAVSAQIDVNFSYHGKKFGKTSLVSNIRIIDGEKYRLEVYLLQHALDVSYTDSAKMIVTISASEVVALSDFENFAPNSLPTVVNNGGCVYTYLPEGIGEMNIVAGSGETTAAFGAPNRVLNLAFTHSGAISPSSNVACPGSDDYKDGADPFDGIPGYLYFTLQPGDITSIYDDGEVRAILTLL